MSSVTAQSNVRATLLSAPLSFEPNVGQAGVGSDQVSFLARDSGYTLFLSPTAATLALVKLITPTAPARPLPGRLGSAMDGLTHTVPMSESVVRLLYVGANSAPQVVGLNPLPRHVNYFIGREPAQWHTNIPTYARVAYHNVYPGIDLVYYGHQGTLEYDWQVRPGADPRAISMAVEGAQALRLDDQGNLVLQTALGVIVQHAPLVYQVIAGRRHTIATRYVLKSDRQIAFALDAYDAQVPLTIDPVLSYSTYLGGSGSDSGQSIAVDHAGDAYVTGQTASIDFPVTAGSSSTTLNGSSDAFVTKLNASGTILAYTAYLGGSNTDSGAGIAVDGAGNAYVTGQTNSADFPTTTGAISTTPRGGTDAFVTKLNADGSSLVYSTYLGGSDTDSGAGIAVDGSGSAYVVGSTYSSDFPTVNAYQGTMGAKSCFSGHHCSSAFVAKLSADGSNLGYSTYLGGSGADSGAGIAVDANGSAYVTGGTFAPDFPLVNPYAGSANSGDQDAFLTKFSPDGRALVYSTYLGISGVVYNVYSAAGAAIALDSNGNVYITGQAVFAGTYDVRWQPHTLRSPIFFGPGVNSGTLAFVWAFNAAGSDLLYDDFIGGSENTAGTGIVVDGQGDATMMGWTITADYPITNYLQACTAPGDAVVTEFNPSGTALNYSTCLGGSGIDKGNGIALDNAGNAYVTGSTASADFPTTNPEQSNPGGSTDAFVAKIGNAPQPAPAPPADQGVITTVAGMTGTGYLGDGGPATSALLSGPRDVVFDARGDMFVSDGYNNVVREVVTGTGVITTVAGIGVAGYSGDGGPASSAAISGPVGLAMDRAGDLFISDYFSGAVREVLATPGVGITSTSTITTIAGTGTPGSGGDSGAATAAHLTWPTGLAFDPAGNLYIADSGNHRVREVSMSTGVITTVAGTGAATSTGDGGPATAATLNGPRGLAFDSAGDLFISEYYGQRVREVVASSGVITTVAGTGTSGYGGDGGRATAATLNAPAGVAVDGAGNVFISEGGNDTVREAVARTGLITTVAGLGPSGAGYNGDGIAATTAEINVPRNVRLDVAGNLYVADAGNNRVREIFGLGAMTPPPSGSIFYHPHHSIRLSDRLQVTVDLATGQAELRADDMAFTARGPSLTLGHVWDSGRAGADLLGPAGQGWQTTLMPGLVGAITGTLTYLDANGATWPLIYTGALTATGSYTSYRVPPGQPWQLTATMTPTILYTLTNFLDGSSQTFDAQGRYLAESDSYSNTNALSYSSAAVSGTLPLTLTNSGGRQLGFSYQSGLLGEARSYNWIKTGASGSGQRVTYGYGGLESAQLITQTWGAGTGDAITATYGYSGTELVTVTTPGHHAWRLGYDAQSRLAAITSPSSGATPSYTTAITYTPGQTTLVEGYGSASPLTTTYLLSAQGEPTVVQDALGHTMRATYDQDHDVLTSTDQKGQVTTNSYLYAGASGSVGLITQTVQPPIAAYTFTNSLSPVVTRYFYDPNTYNLTGTVGAEGGVTLYGYDAHHSVITTTQLLTDTPGSFCQHIARHPGGGTTLPAIMPAPAPGSVRPDTGNNCTYTFGWRASVNQLDQYGEVSGAVDGRGVSAPTTSSGVDNPLSAPPAVTLAANAAQYTRHYSYRSLGDLVAAGTPPISTISGTESSSAPVTTSYAYNYDGLRTNVYPPNGGAISNNFNHLGQWIKTTGQSVPLVGGGNGAPVAQPTYDGDGNIVRLQDALGEATTWSYDPQGRVISSTNPVGSQTLYTYGATTLSSLRDPAGNLTTLGYDAAGELITQSDPAAPSFVTQDGYDPVGNTTAITTPLDDNAPGAASVQTRQYDALNELSSATIGGTGELTPTAAQTTNLAYDHAGGLVQAQAPGGDVSYQTRDRAERVTESDLYPSAVSNPCNPPPTARQAYAYDPVDNLVEQIDFTLYDHQMTYDGANRLSQRQDCFGTCPLNGAITTTPTYDPNGNTVALTRTEPSGAVITATATYNANDWLTQQSSAEGTTTYGYDQAGRQRTQSLLGGAGLLNSAVNAAGWITALTDTVTDTVPTTTTTSSTSLFTYTADAQPMAVTLNVGGAGQVQESRQYDADNRLIYVQDQAPASASPQLVRNYAYTYSPQSRTTAITGNVLGTDSPDGGVWQLNHDALGQLRVDSQKGYGAISWTYDGNGNIQQWKSVDPRQAVGLVTYNYAYPNPSGAITPANWLPNELVSLHYGSDDVTYGYDNSGATTAITDTHHGLGDSTALTTLAYNGAGQPTTVVLTDTSGNRTTLTLTYNASGQRNTIAVTKPGQSQPDFIEHLLYRGDRVGQVVVTGTTPFTETFVYRPDGSPLELLYQVAGQATQRYWYVLDGLGSVVALVDKTGAEVNYYGYDRWGAETGITARKETIPQPLRYRGYWYDAWYHGWDFSNGVYNDPLTSYDGFHTTDGPLPWYWLGVRYYDPYLERFLEPDPSAQDGVRSYVYVHNDPVDLADPSGLAGEPGGSEQQPYVEAGGLEITPGDVLPVSQPVSATSIEGNAMVENEPVDNPFNNSGVPENSTYEQYASRYTKLLPTYRGLKARFGKTPLQDKAAVYAGRAKYYYGYLTDIQREGTTVAVSQLDGKEIVAINSSAPDGAIEAIQEAAIDNQADFVAAEPGEHAEQAIFRVGQGDENFDAIGISNYKGPCQFCRNYFKAVDIAQRPGLYYVEQFVNYP